MNLVRVALLAALASGLCGDGLAAADGRFVEVIDGDTFRWRGAVLRLADADAPDFQPWAKCVREARLASRAKAAAGRLLARGRWWVHIKGRDFYGRALARLSPVGGGPDLAAQLVRKGMAGPRGQDWCSHK